jgi:eukaryotic-like serine/threonine-protein kinase
MNDRDLDLVLAKLADGEAVDWETEERSAGGVDDRRMLQQLRLLEQIAGAHRAAARDAGEDSSATSVLTRAASPPNPEVRPVPSRWGRYKLVQPIGTGGYGVVYLAHDEELDRDLAIKLLHSSLAVREELRSRVRQEGRALARVRHANVLTVYDVEEHEEQLGLCMEYIRGRTLEELIRTDGPLNADEAIVIGQAVCRALAAVHAAGLVHRDVKARNVMRERAGRIVVMDLGAGLDRVPSGTHQSDGVGTPLYMAPELLEGGAATTQSDVYATGVLLYFLLTGEYPVEGRTLADIKEAHRTGRRAKLDERRLDLPAALVHVIERAMAADAAARPASASVLLRELSGVGQVSPLLHVDEKQAPVEPASEPSPSNWARAIRAIALLAGGLLVLATFSGVVANWTFNRVLSRPATFDPASFGDQVMLGLRSLVLPTAVIGILAGLGVVLTLALKVIPWPRQFARKLWPHVAGTLETPAHERAALVARLVVLVALVTLGVVFVVFGDVFYAFANSISVDDLERFSPWRREDESRGLAFRVVMPASLFFVGAAWRAVSRVRLTTGGQVPGSARAAYIAVVVLLLAFQQAPYKLMVSNELPVALVEGAAGCAAGRATVAHLLSGVGGPASPDRPWGKHHAGLRVRRKRVPPVNLVGLYSLAGPVTAGPAPQTIQ